MRNGSHGFWLCIAAAGAVFVVAVPAASAGVHKYDTKLTITRELVPGPNGEVFWHGFVKSDRDRNPEYHYAKAVRKCMEGRRVVLFKQRPGADRKLGTDRSNFDPDANKGKWGLLARPVHLVYARVRAKVRDGYVCRADRSKTVGGRPGGAGT